MKSRKIGTYPSRHEDAIYSRASAASSSSAEAPKKNSDRSGVLDGGCPADVVADGRATPISTMRQSSNRAKAGIRSPSTHSDAWRHRLVPSTSPFDVARSPNGNGSGLAERRRGHAPNRV